MINKLSEYEQNDDAVSDCYTRAEEGTSGIQFYSLLCWYGSQLVLFWSELNNSGQEL